MQRNNTKKRQLTLKKGFWEMGVKIKAISEN